ncbi:MAG: hypothetical protein V3T03_05005 [Candidatus Bipolaricaulota bacterium]
MTEAKLSPYVQLLVAIMLLVALWVLSQTALGKEDPMWVVPFDSGTRVVREVAEALTGDGRTILESYPWGSRLFLGLLTLWPESVRIAGIEWGMRLSLGHDVNLAADLDVRDLAQWCVAQYRDDGRTYDAIVIGSPNGAVAHLAALLGAPFLTTSFGLTFRHDTIDPDNVLSYRETAQVLAETILSNNESDDFEIVCHFDPIHDRSMVKFVDFLRIKLHELPEIYQAFICERLAPGGKLILINCGYTWPQYGLSDHAFLQVGGLGAIASEDFTAAWPVEYPIEIRRESEWGCPEAFANAVDAYAEDQGIEVMEITFDHPMDYSRLAYDAYLACPNVRPQMLLIDCFNHQNPRTNLVTGIPALWLPFNTEEGLSWVDEVLAETQLDTIHFTMLPSFVESPDTASLDAWIEVLQPHGTIDLVGVRPDKFPSDPLAPYRFARDMRVLRKSHGLASPLRLPLDAFAALLAAR